MTVCGSKVEEKSNLIIIGAKQFGYHTDTFHISKCLVNSFNITYLSLDNGLPQIKPQGLNVLYVRSNGGKIARLFRMVVSSVSLIRKKPDSHIFLVYFPLCFLVCLLSRQQIVLDFRTASVAPNRLARVIRDGLATVESLFFPRVSVISAGLARHLHIKEQKYFVLPLGAEVISSVNKKFDVPKLFYIGTFGNRNLHQVIQGLALAIELKPNLRSVISFDIVGFGYNDEESKLKELVRELWLQDIVKFHGRKSHADAKVFFDESNIGISYVPITDYYDHQPPTKTYEYILSGMPVIATATNENSKLINPVNGLLCQDTPRSFAQALLQCLENFVEYDSNAVRETLKDATWQNIAVNFKRQLVSGR
jgi:glycosyltransferase involved in cell wall biosynthesis